MYKQKLRALAREASFPIACYGPDHFVPTPEVVADLRVRSYFEQWKTALENQWFHVKLEDHSLLLFNEGDRPSYSYLHCPLEIPTFKEFLDGMGVENVPAMRRDNAGLYETVVDTATFRAHVTPIRFDYDPPGYRSGVHPVAHLHVGLGNEIRISARRLTAVSFVLFVMRQMYPAAWQRLLQRMDLNRISALVRGVGSSVPSEFWGVADEVELHLR